MKSMESVSHTGVITAITTDTIKVNILQKSACAGCHAKSACTMADENEKEIEIRKETDSHTIGESVNILAKKKQSYQALSFGYLIPLFLIVITMFVCKNIFSNDVYTALASLGILLPYYGILYLKQDLLKQSLQFTIQKTNK